MQRHTTAAARIAGRAAGLPARLSRGPVLLCIGVVTAAFLWTITVAPAPVALALTAAAAAAWCAWLETHPEKERREPARAPIVPAITSGPIRAGARPVARGRRQASAFCTVLVTVGGLSVPRPAAGQSLAESGAAGAPAVAQEPSAPTDPDPWRNLTFGATLEGYYQYNWNRPPDRVIPLRAYDTRANTFGIQQVAFVVDAPPDVDAGRRYGLRADLQWGQATETVQGSAANEPRPEVYRNVWQVYGTYLFPVGPNGLQTDFGKFASLLGYETNYAKDNQAFSRAYLFNFLPFYHSGLRVTYPVNEKVSVLYMLTNGIQQTEDFNDVKSSHVAAIVKPASALTWTVNYFVGQEQPDGGEPGGPDGFFRVFDTYVAFTATPALTLGLDVNYVTNEVSRDADPLSLQGTGAYARYQLTQPVGLGLRYERLDDEGLFGGIDQVLQEITMTAEYELADGFLARLEFRCDWSNERFFPGRNGADDLKAAQHTLLLGGIWVIGTKKGAW